MTLETDIEDIRTRIRAGEYRNEAAVSHGIVQRLLHALGWPTYDTRVVSPEHAVEGRRVDFALCHPPNKPTIFVEVKQLGQSVGAERQLFEYAFHQGIPLVVLTDGQDWHFFLPAEQGNYGERRVYKLDIVERDMAECVYRLNRYLSYDQTVSGRAIDVAREDYRNVARDRQIRSALPQAWAALISEPDELLIELVAERVENLCGFQPAPDVVAAFLTRSAVPVPDTSATPRLGERSNAPAALSMQNEVTGGPFGSNGGVQPGSWQDHLTSRSPDLLYNGNVSFDEIVARCQASGGTIEVGYDGGVAALERKPLSDIRSKQRFKWRDPSNPGPYGLPGQKRERNNWVRGDRFLSIVRSKGQL